MSFVLNKNRILSTQTGKFFSFFCILWLLSGIVLLAHSHVLKNRIQEHGIEKLSTALNSYIQQKFSHTRSNFSLQATIPQSIDFIRITRDGEQLLITGKGDMAFQGLVNLDPLSQGAWIDLATPYATGEWLLVSRKLPQGGVIQAGLNDLSSGIATYTLSVSLSTWLFLLSALPCLGLSFLLTSLSRAPIRKLESSIKRALTKKSLPPPEDSFHAGELSKVNHLLAETFSQNQQLIAEMQSSLDNVAHDLRTPMTRLRTVAEYALQSDREDPELYRNALSDCLEESERVLSMLKVMMSVAEAEAGTMRLHREQLNIPDTLDDVVNLYQYVAEEEKINVILHIEEADIQVLADKTRISQVWANLLDNAIKYSHDSGIITIDVSREADNAVIQFTDNGMGISDTEVERIWERLYRGDRSRTKQGLGLGLNYVKAVIEAHGGTVGVTSKIKEGSCFEVRLPLISD